MSANIVFVNIDWKEAMMHKTLSNNLERLSDTIKDVVSMMQPTMICMCEVGVTSHLLSHHQMQIMADAAIRAWQDAATEHIDLCSMFEKGAPYMTVYIDGPIKCSGHRILRDLYTTGT